MKTRNIVVTKLDEIVGFFLLNVFFLVRLYIAIHKINIKSEGHVKQVGIDACPQCSHEREM